MPILLYLPWECLRFGVIPSKETISIYLLGARLLLADWWNRARKRWSLDR
jgi:hypothetical protein